MIRVGVRRAASAATAAALLAGCGASDRPGTRAARSNADSAAAAASGRPARTPPERDVLSRLVALGHPVYCGGGRGREVALTFDDGPGVYSHLALRKLRAAHVRATFFLVGRNLAGRERLVRAERRIAALGDHTWTHRDLRTLAFGAVYGEVTSTQRAVRRVSARSVKLFRPPYGSHTAALDRLVRAAGMLSVVWDVDSRDYAGADYRGIIANTRAGIGPGAIVLLHENHGQTIRALPTILAELRRRRLRAVSVPELLRADPPSAAQLRAGVAGCPARARRALPDGEARIISTRG